MANLEKAIELAVEAHRGQTDKAGRPYILHPLYLMQQFEEQEAMIVAVLHDSVEDSDLTLDDLTAAGFSSDVIAAIDALTHRMGESYDQYLQRVQSHPLATRVKLADLQHNMDIRRMSQIQERDLERLAKYHKAWLKLRR